MYLRVLSGVGLAVALCAPALPAMAADDEPMYTAIGTLRADGGLEGSGHLQGNVPGYAGFSWADRGETFVLRGRLFYEDRILNEFQPLPGARLEVTEHRWGQDPIPRGELTTGGDGSFTLSGVADQRNSSFTVDFAGTDRFAAGHAEGSYNALWPTRFSAVAGKRVREGRKGRKRWTVHLLGRMQRKVDGGWEPFTDKTKERGPCDLRVQYRLPGSKTWKDLRGIECWMLTAKRFDYRATAKPRTAYWRIYFIEPNGLKTAYVAPQTHRSSVSRSVLVKIP